MSLAALAKRVRYHILQCTTEAASGHPTSSLSATDLMSALFHDHLRFDFQNPLHPNNDRLIFSKGHAAPLLFALYTACGQISESELKSLRRISSNLEGHPTPRHPLVEVATGSLGQGLSIGVGMALNAQRVDHLSYRTFVLLGDGEMAEGSVWEALQLASYYQLKQLIAIVDVNRMGQSQQTMLAHQTEVYVQRLEAFGWEVLSVDGHDLAAIQKALTALLTSSSDKPRALVAKTYKGAGISFLADRDGWHGRALSSDDLNKALAELGPIDKGLTFGVRLPETMPEQRPHNKSIERRTFKMGDSYATRNAFGEALAHLVGQHPEIISIDGDTKNSTFAQTLMEAAPEHFFEMFIAEQNMIGVAVGLAKRGKKVFASTFGAFLTRAYDQIRMAAVSQANFVCVGSHCGVSIGEDGPSQMALEDLAMFRAVCGSTVLYPADAHATFQLVKQALKQPGIIYLRTNRPKTEIIYGPNEEFPIGGSKTIKSCPEDRLTLIGAGVTLYEALKAHGVLAAEGVNTRVIDLYSVKPVDRVTLKQAAQETGRLLVIEDHWFEGGLGDAVYNAFEGEKPPIIHKLAVTQMPRSGKPEELLDAHGLSARAIIAKVKEIL